MQSKAGQLPFTPDSVGSHWSSRVQVDAAALNWKTPLVLKDLSEGGRDGRYISP
jgi:hypothetical protein